MTILLSIIRSLLWCVRVCYRPKNLFSTLDSNECATDTAGAKFLGSNVQYLRCEGKLSVIHVSSLCHFVIEIDLSTVFVVDDAWSLALEILLTAQGRKQNPKAKA